MRLLVALLACLVGCSSASAIAGGDDAEIDAADDVFATDTGHDTAAPDTSTAPDMRRDTSVDTAPPCTVKCQLWESCSGTTCTPVCVGAAKNRCAAIKTGEIEVDCPSGWTPPVGCYWVESTDGGVFACRKMPP